MIENTIISLSCELTPNQYYTNEFEKNVLDIFRNLFVGRCHSGCFILSIEKILRRSDLVISPENGANIPFSGLFEIKCVKYYVDEIIEANIYVLSNDVIILKNENTILFDNKKTIPFKYKIGDSVKVKIVDSSYSYNEKNIVASCIYIEKYEQTLNNIYSIIGDQIENDYGLKVGKSYKRDFNKFIESNASDSIPIEINEFIKLMKLYIKIDENNMKIMQKKA